MCFVSFFLLINFCFAFIFPIATIVFHKPIKIILLTNDDLTILFVFQAHLANYLVAI